MRSCGVGLFIFFSLVLLTSTDVASVRILPDLVSDGGDGHRDQEVPSYLQSALSPFFSSTSGSCDETYGFMPCTSTVIGNLFSISVYGFLMFSAQKLLSDGSELLLEILGPGIVGGLVLPILGALPDAMLILVSGLSGSKETAQSQVSVGMGLLAGSTVMLLTVMWGASVVAGKRDLQESGVSTDNWTRYAAMIMVGSVVPFIVVQVPQLLSSSSGRRLAILIGLILSLVLLISYCACQVAPAGIAATTLNGEQAHYRDFSRAVKEHAFVGRLFKAIDLDHDDSLSAAELSAFVIGIRLDELKLDESDVVQKVMEEFNTTPDSRITFDEFQCGISNWLRDSNVPRSQNGEKQDTVKYLDGCHQETRRQQDLLEVECDEAEEGGIENPKKEALKAASMLLAGTIIAAVFADPLDDVIVNFSSATSIPTFFIFIQCGDDEQRPLPRGVSCPRVCQGTDMGFLIRSSHHRHRLCRDGLVGELPHEIPSLDIGHSFCALPDLSAARLHSRPSIGLVLDSDFSKPRIPVLLLDPSNAEIFQHNRNFEVTGE
ncbi:hypothetical protein Nepgr_022324 [Nepenthes gracilis]|uniref:EF-hand domain-containing protein n=1 Tax=Nepenthes gracilis TaxID=150966 RepID=A0AAD3T021_NEPGR|nr:hypothetical protein Nepgr_022324 [Nepenthes gracilis]